MRPLVRPLLLLSCSVCVVSSVASPWAGASVALAVLFGLCGEFGGVAVGWCGRCSCCLVRFCVAEFGGVAVGWCVRCSCCLVRFVWMSSVASPTLVLPSFVASRAESSLFASRLYVVGCYLVCLCKLVWVAYLGHELALFIVSCLCFVSCGR